MAEKKVYTPREINQLIWKRFETDRDVFVSPLKGQPYIAVGIPSGKIVQVQGDAGDFFAALTSGASVTLNGNATRFCGDSMFGGELIVNGDTGTGTGQYMRGGMLVVKGDCKGTVGQLMRGGTIIVDGRAGKEVGKYMMGGEIIIAGDTGERTGENMMKGTIYLQGEPASLGLNAKLQKLATEDMERLKYLHKQYKFRKIREEELLAEFQKVVPETSRPLTGGVRK